MQKMRKLLCFLFDTHEWDTHKLASWSEVHDQMPCKYCDCVLVIRGYHSWLQRDGKVVAENSYFR